MTGGDTWKLELGRVDLLRSCINVDLRPLERLGYTSHDDFEVIEEWLDAYMEKHVLPVCRELSERVTRGCGVFPLSEHEKFACTVVSGVSMVFDPERSDFDIGRVALRSAVPVKFVQADGGGVEIVLNHGSVEEPERGETHENGTVEKA